MPEKQAASNSSITLTQTTKMGRLVIKYGGIALAVLIVGRIFLSSFIRFWKAINPPPPPPPTVGFGRLPAVNFPEQTSQNKPAQYQLETPKGGLPDFGDRVKVLLMVQSTANLLADQKAREIAASYDFVFEPEVISGNIYRWTKSQPLNTQLEMNIFTHHFELSTDYLSRPELIANNELPDDYNAVQHVKDFLKRTDLLPPDIATAAGEIVYLKSLGGELGPAVSHSDADFIQVDLNRVPIDGQYRMYGPEGYKGTIHAIVSGFFQGQNSIMALDYQYQPVDYDQVETYPIRDPRQAWKIMQSGEGYIASGQDQESVTIRQVQLGYFESTQEQDYLQPIYVFSGDNEFLGYVSAIEPTYTQAQ